MVATPPELKVLVEGHLVWFLLFSCHDLLGVYGWSLECLLNDGFEMLDLFNVGQFGEQFHFSVAFSWNVLHLKVVKIINEGSCNMVVPEQYYLHGLIFVGNLPFHKLRVNVVFSGRQVYRFTQVV